MEKILIVSDGHGEIYGRAFFSGFKSHGYHVDEFTWNKYFSYNSKGGSVSKLHSFIARLQDRFLIGTPLTVINIGLYDKCIDFKPDLIFIYRGTHILPKTIKKIKGAIKCKVFAYNNDDPFSTKHKAYIWRHYINSITLYDHVFAYRYSNISKYKSIGCDKVTMLRSHYDKDRNYPIKNISNRKYMCDVIFLGHFENDGRDQLLKLLVDKCINVKIYGTQWEKSEYYKFFKDQCNEIIPIYGEDYNLAINCAKIALVFLSKINSDTYTRRSFEIPATQTMMMSEYSKDLAENLFTQGIEAEYFHNKDELLNKIDYYLSHTDEIGKIGIRGYNKLISSGHELSNRIEQIMDVYHH